MIRGFLNLDRKGNAVNPYGLFVLGVVTGINVGIWLVEMVFKQMVRVAT